jgi:1-acyl-sn-glycerol-3-phosphate acyltransferase
LNSPAPLLVPAQYPRRNAPIARALGRWLMRVSGWRFCGSFPDVPKLIISVAPHTSNWDFIVGVMALWALDIRISFIGKHTLFKGPFGRWLRSLGGIPVNRSKSHGVVGEVIDAFNASERMIFALAPEGTRQLDKGFKSGFLHMAYGAKVPVVLAYFDFATRTIGFGEVLLASGDAGEDLQLVLDFYRPVRGKYTKDWQRAARSL